MRKYKKIIVWGAKLDTGHTHGFIHEAIVRAAKCMGLDTYWLDNRDTLDDTFFDDAIIIVDEMQNMTFEEIDTVMTRVGYRSKIIWCGDYRQTDLNKKKTDVSGILKFFDIAYHMGAFTKIEFQADDIVRSSLVKDYILAKIRYEDICDK